MGPAAPTPGPLPDDAKWEAVVACDKSRDSRFVYGVKTTGIFCRPSCGAKRPLRRNVLFFDTAGDAVAAGFRPCKKCRPDQPAHDPGREMVERAKSLYDAHFGDPRTLKALVEGLGVSPNHLMRLFKSHEGQTQGQYLVRRQIEKAKELLRRTDLDIVRISLECGFESLSNFYKRFKEQTGATPMQWRSAQGTQQ